MRTTSIPVLALSTLSVLTAACASPQTSAVAVAEASAVAVVDVDPAARKALFSSVTALEGSWQGAAPDGTTGHTVFAVSSGGTLVRELMLAGTEHEMTNMYTLDGSELVLTHYCAMGNQPTMRADALEDGRLAFSFDEVADLTASDEIYMGEMTLEIVDADHIRQHWTAFKGSEPQDVMTIELTRAP